MCVLKNSLGEGINSKCAACLTRPDRQQQQLHMHTTGPAFKLYACMCVCTYVIVGICENLHTHRRSTPKNSPHSLSFFSFARFRLQTTHYQSATAAAAEGLGMQ